MTTQPAEERPESQQAVPGAADGSAPRTRKRRRKSRKQSRPVAAPAVEFDNDFDFDDDDDLELPSYGKRFARGTEEASDKPRKTVKPVAVKPQAAKPAVLRPQAEAKAKQKSPLPAGFAVKRPATAKPQAAVHAKLQATQKKPIEEKPPVADMPPVAENRPIAEKSRRQRPPAGERPRSKRPPIAGRPPVVERPPAGEEPQFEKPLRERPPRERPAAEHPRPAATRDKLAQSEKFAALGLSAVMLDALAVATYQEPTPVQAGFIPRALTGVDVMGQAQTGTGKTAAFAIPILEMLQPQRRGGPPQALALVPTRELAVQVRDECEKLALGRNVSIVAVYGGKPIRKQIEQVNQGASFIVGTPGRVLDLMSRGALVWSDLRVVVLDEADRMLDIGFRPDIEKILRRCPQSRQTLLLSATLAPPVKRLAERYMREPEVLDFSPKNLAVETIEQFYFTVDPERKFDLLVKLLEREDPKQAIIFCRTKRGTDKICTRLSRRFQSVDTIHGDLQQSARDRVMKAFREGRVRWLVATDVVGRGIDVTSISHIINFDIPAFCDDYVHRVGRTGRMGREGVAYTFVSPEEGGELTRIEIRINRLLIRDEIPGFQAFGDPRPADSVVLGDGPGSIDDDLVESPKPASLPVFGKPVRRIRRAL
ncbi:MAG: DEAD/DEAH box helicase [Thermoguttaceae bacterium]